MTAVARPKIPTPPPLTGPPGFPDQLFTLPLTQLRESKWNPRKHYDPAKLAEMVASLKKGQLAPIIVRPWAVDRDRFIATGSPAGITFELGAGHRRFRSSPEAGISGLLAIVRDMDDVALLELLNFENKQRDDIEPLDEAEGFKLLMEKAGYKVERMAERIGLSKQYVYDRLKLLQLIPELKKYLQDNIITAGHAILLARLTPADQKRVMGNPSRMNRYGYSDGTGLFQPDHADHDPDQPSLELKQPIKARSVRELATYINDHVRFKPEENDLPNLFPAAEAALEEAKGDDLTPVYITYDHQLEFDAKDNKVRTYGVMSWRRADGQKRSKTCDWSRVGIVAAGRHRGDGFRVCVNRDKCETHFPESARRAKQRAKADRKAREGIPVKPARVQSATDLQREIQREQARQDREEARWKAQQEREAALEQAEPKVLAQRAPAIAKRILAIRKELRITPAMAAFLWKEGLEPIEQDIIGTGSRYGDEIVDAVSPLLPGKTWGKDRDGQLSAIATLFWFSTETKGLDKELGKAAAALVDAELKAKAKTKAEKKPATKKAKKGPRK